MDVSAYLNRINHRGSTKPTAETLRALHRAHLLTVPFENLDIHLDHPIILEENALFEKIVRKQRGGFCYELNGLFAVLLHELGFRVGMLNSLIPEKHNGCGMAYDHPILLVELDERWIVDVGFGDAYRLPLKLDERGQQMGVGVAYNISPDGDGRWKFHERLENGEWEFYYSFTLQPCRLSDFVEACRYYEKSPQSGFTQKRICSRAIANGQVSLTDDRLIVTQDGRKEEIPLVGEQDFVHALREHFGITLDKSFPNHKEEADIR